MLVNKKITVIFIIFLAVIFLLPDISHAQNDVYGINDLTNTNLTTRPLEETITNIINIALGFLGILATIIILYGGFVWMTSQGAAEKVDRAKKIIISGVIGLLIILSAYAIARFVINQYQNGGPGGNGPGGNGDHYGGGIGLGAGVLESHYPARGAQDIPRNTNIYVTFKEPIDIGFIRYGGDCNLRPPYTACVDADYIKIIHNDDIPLGESSIDGEDIMVAFDADHKVFEFNPYGNDSGTDDYLGEDGDDVRYQIVLDSLNRANGQPAFLNGFYQWQFTVSSVVDLTPPQVTSVIPPDDSPDNPRNSAVQIHFSEAINPIFAAGDSDDSDYIHLDLGGVEVSGQYLISNQYRTVEFITEDFCGTNSCGGEVYCLPGGADIVGTVTTAIRDMAGNQLAADFVWNFITNDDIDLVAPRMIDMSDAIGGQFALDQPLRMEFDKNLLSSSINSDNIYFEGGDINFWSYLDDDGRTIILDHDDFEIVTPYTPTMTSGIKDWLQNCWHPCACDDPDGSCECNQDNSPACAAGTHCQTNN